MTPAQILLLAEADMEFRTDKPRKAERGTVADLRALAALQG